jgi:hypothetical protein
MIASTHHKMDARIAPSKYSENMFGLYEFSRHCDQSNSAIVRMPPRYNVKVYLRLASSFQCARPSV